MNDTLTVIIVCVTEPDVTCTEMMDCISASYPLPRHHVCSFDLDYIKDSLVDLGNNIDASNLWCDIIDHEDDRNEPFSREIICKICTIFHTILHRKTYDILLLDARLISAYTIDDWLNLYSKSRKTKFAYLEIGSKVNHPYRNLMALRRIEIKSVKYSENIIQRSRKILLPIIKD